MSVSNFIKDVNALYHFYNLTYHRFNVEASSGNYSVNTSIPLYHYGNTTLLSCPCCNHETNPFSIFSITYKSFTFKHFPYIPPEAKRLFSNPFTEWDAYTFYKAILDDPVLSETHPLTYVKNNHAATTFSLDRLNHYHQLLESFSSSQFFSKDLLLKLNKVHLNNNLLHTCFCDNCSSDIIVFPSKEKVSRYQDFTFKEQQHIYTTIALAVAFTYAFGNKVSQRISEQRDVYLFRRHLIQTLAPKTTL